MNSQLIETLLFRVGGTLCGWGYRLEQRRLRDVPKCPDCNIGPDVGDDCPICADMQRETRDERDMLASAYGEGFEDGRRDMSR